MNLLSKRRIKLFLILIFSFFLINIGIASAETLSDWELNTKLGASTKYNVNKGSSNDIAVYVGSLLKWIPMLGVTFIIQMVLAGYEWMTASGDSKKVDDAKKRIRYAVIGLLMFIGLYVISYFIYDKLLYIANYNER